MSVDPGVLARARARVLGPVPISPADPTPAGMGRAPDGARVWPLPSWPDGATPALLEEYRIAGFPLDRPGQIRRVFAAALRCCWDEPDGAPWPGRTAPIPAALEVYASMSRGDPALMRRWALGELRRLADTGWLLLDEQAGGVRLGPRVATWPPESLGSLRDLLRRLPHPPEQPAAPKEGAVSEDGAVSADGAIEDGPMEDGAISER